MSRIYFHSEHDDTEVGGAERAHMACLCNDVFLACIGSLVSDGKRYACLDWRTDNPLNGDNVRRKSQKSLDVGVDNPMLYASPDRTMLNQSTQLIYATALRHMAGTVTQTVQSLRGCRVAHLEIPPLRR